MALAARWLARRFNRPGFAMFDYDVYTLDAAVRASENAGEAQLPTLQCLLLRGEDRLPDHTVDTLGAVDHLGDMIIDAALCGGIIIT
jgi:hypothetical protein